MNYNNYIIIIFVLTLLLYYIVNVVKYLPKLFSVSESVRTLFAGGKGSRNFVFNILLMIIFGCSLTLQRSFSDKREILYII